MWDILSRLFGTFERPSPSDIVPRDSITNTQLPAVLPYVTIEMNKLNLGLTKTPRVWMPSIPDTNSMDGTFDKGHNNILISGQDGEEQLRLRQWLEAQPPGNIVVYRIEDKIYAIHRIIKVGKDNQGVYFIIKGDNNSAADPYRVRSENIEWLSIGIIY